MIRQHYTFSRFRRIFQGFSQNKYCFQGCKDDPAGAPELRVENPPISGARNSKSVKTPENWHSKTPMLGHLERRFDRVFPGCQFSGVRKANARVSGGGNSTF